MNVLNDLKSIQGSVMRMNASRETLLKQAVEIREALELIHKSGLELNFEAVIDKLDTAANVIDNELNSNGIF